MPCDPFEMALVHRGFRRELHNAADLVRGVAAGDDRRAAVVGRHIDFMMAAVHFHHSAEDEFVWPRLSARVPGRVAELRRMEDAHRAIDEAGERVRAAAITWVKAADPGAVDGFAAEITRFALLADHHFDDEERTVVPLIAEHLSPGEWRKFLAHGSAFVRTNPRRGLALGGIVLNGVPEATRQRFLGNLPLPLRAVFKAFGPRVYAGYRAEVYGS